MKSYPAGTVIELVVLVAYPHGGSRDLGGYMTKPFVPPGRDNKRAHKLYNMEYLRWPEPPPKLVTGTPVRVVYTHKDQPHWFWEMRWEPAPFEHSDLYGSGYEGYEYED
jgi:hypothetical protein